MIDFKAKFAKCTVPALALVAALQAQAENIYQAGSEGDELYHKVQYLLPPEVAPIFIPLSDKARVIRGINPDAFVDGGLTDHTVSYLMGRIGQKLTSENGVAAYTVTGSNIPGNDKRQRICGIVFTSDAALRDETTLTHEAIHCKNAYVNGTDEYKKAALPAWQLSKHLSARQFMTMLDEATAGGLQVAYAYNSGRTAGLKMVERYARYNKNGVVSIGFRTARGLLEVCGRKGACPTDSIGMINTIVQDKKLLSALMTDMFEIQAESEKLGLVIADQ